KPASNRVLPHRGGSYRFPARPVQVAMVIRDLIGDVLRTLWAHKLRTLLTMFGIAWGIVSIVLMVAAGEGLRVGKAKRGKPWGKDFLFVFHGAPTVRGGGRRVGRE